MNEQVPLPRTTAALEARRQRTAAKVNQVSAAVAALRREKAPVTAAAVARRAHVSRTFLYENSDARKLLSQATDQAATHGSVAADVTRTGTDTAWRERALNAEDALKAAHAEVRTQRGRIAQLMGHMRDLETEQTTESIDRITAENSNLKQRLRESEHAKRTLEERLQAARSNNRFQDRRIAQLEAQLLETRSTP
ncbi:DUF6262 family protein [Kitasatospora sp. NPDC004723]|uniref:DUF6262 family protein n=1 Tax=Kitasatospora sp. NPDC004723 TaxID=3154288 RepID=UPI0033B5F736